MFTVIKNLFKKSNSTSISTPTIHTYKVVGIGHGGSHIETYIQATSREEARRKVMGTPYKEARAYINNDARDYSVQFKGIDYVICMD